MSAKEITSLLPEEPFDLEGDALLAHLFTEAVREKKEKKGLSEVSEAILEEYNELSKYLESSEIQSPLAVRTTLFARRLATLLIDELGEVRENRLEEAIQSLEKNLFSLGPGRHLDALRREHVLKMLKQLKGDKEFRLLLKKIDAPHQNRIADRLIRETLLLPKEKAITPAAARRAALSALLTYLRQSVGSCFATAPAILIQREQPKQLLKDLAELLGTGSLKRTFEGNEYQVPLSFTSGAGDLRKPVFVHGEEGAKVWLSPGLINALESVDLIDKELFIQKKRQRLKELLKKSLEMEPHLFTAERALKEILMQHHKTNEEEVLEAQNRPIGMVQGGILLASGGESAVLGRVNSYLNDFETASRVFKSLADNALLKAWEFTIASYTETKSNFSKWNLYTSLGLNAQDRGGLGERLYVWIQRKLEEEKSKSSEIYGKYEQLHTELRFMEGRLRRASSENEGRWLRSQYQTLLNEYRTYEEMLSKIRWRSESFANLFDVVIHSYMQLFPSYFQEIYDAEMHHVTTSPYDDSPAGFQLIFKHGRQNPGAWTEVKSLGEYVDSLVSFFHMTEQELIHDPVMKGFEEDLGEMVSMWISHVRSEEFLESALYRMAARQGGRLPEKPLEHLEQVEKKPWAYTSGGNLETLIQCYFKRRTPPKHVDRWMENPTELLLFLVDVLKESPPKEKEKLMLMTSPTHAFLLMPYLETFRKAWESDAFTYTWCRDTIIDPIKEFIYRQHFDQEMIEFLLDEMKRDLPEGLKREFENAFKQPPRYLSSTGFRQFVVEQLKKESRLAPIYRHYLNETTIDALLYRLLPLARSYQVSGRVELILKALHQEAQIERAMQIYERSRKRAVISAEGLFQLIQSALLTSPFTELDLKRSSAKAMRDLGFMMPEPFLFADTNWIESWFGLTVNPGTGEVELFRHDPLALTGYPMVSWKKWLNGKNRSPSWEIFSHPHEYLLE